MSEYSEEKKITIAQRPWLRRWCAQKKQVCTTRLKEKTFIAESIETRDVKIAKQYILSMTTLRQFLLHGCTHKRGSSR